MGKHNRSGFDPGNLRNTAILLMMAKIQLSNQHFYAALQNLCLRHFSPIVNTASVLPQREPVGRGGKKVN
jgi:hypothetical protein